MTPVNKIENPKYKRAGKIEKDKQIKCVIKHQHERIKPKFWWKLEERLKF